MPAQLWCTVKLDAMSLFQQYSSLSKLATHFPWATFTLPDALPSLETMAEIDKKAKHRLLLPPGADLTAHCREVLRSDETAWEVIEPSLAAGLIDQKTALTMATRPITNVHPSRLVSMRVPIDALLDTLEKPAMQYACARAGIALMRQKRQIDPRHHNRLLAYQLLRGL